MSRSTDEALHILDEMSASKSKLGNVEKLYEIRSFSPMIQTGCNVSPFNRKRHLDSGRKSMRQTNIKRIEEPQEKPQTLSDSNSLKDPI